MSIAWAHWPRDPMHHYNMPSGKEVKIGPQIRVDVCGRTVGTSSGGQ